MSIAIQLVLIFLAAKQALTFRNLTHSLTFLVEYRVIQEYAGTFRDPQGQSGECLVMQGIQGNKGEYRGIQGNTGE